jgi:SAM-dependent methyltransferase
VSKKLVREYYGKCASAEWRRLARDPYHRLEFDTTLHFLRKYLPAKGLVLDAGGGPGRYTIALARLGYDMVLLDLAPESLDIARREIRKAEVGAKVRKVTVGSIDDLSAFPDSSFDAVLCLGGPLSHLLQRSRRRKAISELVRVARRGAPVFVSVIGQMALCVNSVNYLSSEMVEGPRVYWKYVRTGDYHGGYGFTATHTYLPEELEADLKNRAKVITMVGLEGVFSTHPRECNRAFRSKKHAPIVRELHMKTCTHPVAVGMSEHFLAVCRK